MNEKMTLSARRALFAAQQEGRTRGSSLIEPEHLLLGLLSQPETVGCYVLRRLRVDAMSLWERTESSLKPGGAMPASSIEPSPDTEKVLAVAEASLKELGDLFIGTEHILLGLTRVQSVASACLTAAGADAQRVTNEVTRLQEAPPPHVVTDEAASSESPIARIGHQIMVEALRDGVDEIHIEPSDAGVRVGYLLHGAVSEAMTVPKHIAHPLASSFRGLINMKPPDGSGSTGTIRLSYKENEYDLIVSFDKVEHGDRMIMRLLACPGLEPIPSEPIAGPVNYSNARSQRMAPPSGPSPLADVLNTHALRGRDLIGIEELTADEIMLILDVAARLKAHKFDATQTQFAQGQTLAMLFEKPSLRTRVTFEAGMTQLGGSAIYLEGRLGIRETVPDVARNLERWIDGIMARTFHHQTVLDLADNANIPVINGLSDREHPCQALADLQTIGERKGKLTGLKLAYVGDGNNMANSLVLAAAKLGMHFSIACPSGYEIMDGIWRIAEGFAAETGARLLMTANPEEAVTVADVVYTDVWTSMGQEEETAARLKIFAPYQVNEALMAAAKPEAIVMHCLPAHRGEEISAEVFDGPQSVVFDQAENRLHAQKAVLSLVL